MASWTWQAVVVVTVINFYVTQQYEAKRSQDLDVVNNQLESRQKQSDGYRLATAKQYLILAPKMVRAGTTYRLSVSINEISSERLIVRAILTRNQEEYSTGDVTFLTRGTKQLLVKVPENLVSGRHKLTVLGLTGNDTVLPIFREEYLLEYRTKRVSLFVQMDKPVYYPPGRINFRIVAVYPDLTPAAGSMTFFLVDGRGFIVRRDLSEQLNFGIYEGYYNLEYPVNVGIWKMIIEAFGHRYVHEFPIVNYFFRRYEVNVSAPLYVMDSEPALIGYIKGEHMSRKEAYGNATIMLRCMDGPDSFMPGNIIKDLGYVRGTKPFSIPMLLITDLCGGEPEYHNGKTLYLEGWLYDWDLEETQNGTALIKLIRDDVRVERLGNRYTAFIPEKPFVVYFAVKRADGSPYKNTTHRTLEIEVTHEGEHSSRIRQEVIIPDDAIVRYMVIPQVTDQKIYVKALHINSSHYDEVVAYRYYSHNGYYLTVTTSTKEPATDEYMVFTVKTNFFVSEITFVMMSKGQIEIVNTLEMSSKQKTFSIALSRQLLPSARIIVYTTVKDYVLMDSMNIHIKDRKLTTGSLKRNLGKDFTRNTLELIGRGPIGSFMSLIGQHYQWVIRGADTFITEKKIMRDLETYTRNETEPYHHIWYYNDTRWDEDVYFASETCGLDGNTTLKGAGLLVITDMRLSFAMGDELVCNISLGQGQCISGQCFDLSLACDGWPDCPDGYDEAGCPDLTPPVERPKEDLSLFPFYTLYMDNDWNFKKSYVKPNLGGQVELSLDAPEVLDTYVFHSFFVHPNEGIVLINESVVHDLTRWFFMRCEGPEQLRRGEQVGIRCALFNKWDQIIEVMVMLHGSNKFRFINVEDFGIVSSYKPRTTAGDIQIMVSMFPGEERYIIWPIQPHVVKDDITIKISAMSVIHKDEEELSIPITYDGCINEVYTVYYIDLVAFPSMYTPYLDTEIPQNWYQPGERDLLYIPGSPKGLVSLWGGVGVPGFWLDYYDADLAAGLPHDCLEGYIFDFAYNWLNLDYLQAINRLEDDDKYVVLDYMRTTLMRQYAYLTDEGGFKMFRRAKKPVVWLTAVCLNYINEFFKSEWAEEVFIPVEILNKIVIWLVKQQNSEGAFIETSEHIYNRYFHNVSMTTSGINYTWSIITTSYTVQTLAKCTLLTGEAKLAAAQAVTLGAEYIAEKFFYLVDVLDISTAAMALERAQHPLKDDAYYKLKSMARHERYTYFSNIYIEPNPIKMVDNKQIIGTRTAPEILGAACTATGWALDLYLIHNEFEAAKPIVLWLIEQHMDFFTLAACVDTLIGVEAMNNYAKRETNYHFTNMKITVTAQSTEGWQQVIYINSTNFPNYHQFFMPEPCWGTIAAHAEGTGFARFQVFTDHQVEKIHQVWTTPYDTFKWTMNEVEYLGRNASIMRPNYCVRWLRPDMAPASGMTNLWWFTPSGYVVDRDEIEMKYADIENTGMIRIRPRDGVNWVWHEYIDTEGWCFNTTLRRWYPISNYSVSHFIGVYEYSEPNMYDFTGYSTYTLHNLHICQVCGSFQCPYCPWYNSASSLSISSCLCLASLFTSLSQFFY